MSHLNLPKKKKKKKDHYLDKNKNMHFCRKGMALPNHTTLHFVNFRVASNLWPAHINNFCILEDPCAAYICRAYIQWNTKKK